MIENGRLDGVHFFRPNVLLYGNMISTEEEICAMPRLFSKISKFFPRGWELAGDGWFIGGTLAECA